MHAPLAARLAAVAVLALSASPAAAAVVVLQPSSQDAYVQMDKPNRITGAGPTHTRIRIEASLAGTKTRRGLVQFDLSAIPFGSTVNSAILELFEGNNPNVTVVHGVHRADQPWLQSAVKWNNQPAHQAVPTDTTPVPDDTTREFRSFDVTVDLQAFVSVCATNHGWVVRDQSEAGTSEDVNYVAREEDSPAEVPAHYPKLTVDFDPPPCTTDAECGDGSACTTNEHCEGGVCVVDPVDCDDADPCTDDICDCIQGCINAPICNDGFACTIDTCDPGTLACTNSPVDALCLDDCVLAATCAADPDSVDVDPVTGCDVTATSPPGTPCDDGQTCSTGGECDGAGQCVAGTPTVCDHYVGYKVTASKIEALPDLNKFPQNWNVSLDDVTLANDPPDLFPYDPENFLVKKEKSIINPAMKNTEPGPFRNVHYMRYQAKRAAEGVGPENPPGSGKFPKPLKAPKRAWHVTNQFGDLFLDTKDARALWVPTGKAEAPGSATDPGDATHFLCYKAKAGKTPSAQAPDNGSGKGKFRKDLQHYFEDQFDDCAVLKDGVTIAFAGTPVEGKCLYDLKKPVEICNPVDKSAVVPPRSTSATVTGSTAVVRDQSLLCYQAKLTAKVRSAAAAALGGVAVDDQLQQRKHVKHRLKDGTQVSTFPGNLFPRPVAVDTKKTEMVCIPTDVLSVSDL